MFATHSCWLIFHVTLKNVGGLARVPEESKDKSPTVMLGIPHEVVFAHVRLEHHHLQCTIHVLHESHA